jgi:uncharacterized Fe-S cluster protein YjdI
MSGKLHVYRGGEVTVTFDKGVCIHAGNCVRGLPAVFDLKGKPWVQPDEASAAEVVAQVGRCPSGALQIAAREE